MDAPKVGDRFEILGSKFELLPEFQVTFHRGVGAGELFHFTSEEDAVEAVKRRMPLAHIEPWNLVHASGSAIQTVFYRTKGEQEKQLEIPELTDAELRSALQRGQSPLPDYAAGIIVWTCDTTD